MCEDVRPMEGSKNGDSFLISDVGFWSVGLVKGLIIGSAVFSSQKTVTEESGDGDDVIDRLYELKCLVCKLKV